jgi:hypothetical protein
MGYWGRGEVVLYDDAGKTRRGETTDLGAEPQNTYPYRGRTSIPQPVWMVATGGTQRAKRDNETRESNGPSRGGTSSIR